MHSNSYEPNRRYETQVGRLQATLQVESGPQVMVSAPVLGVLSLVIAAQRAKLVDTFLAMDLMELGTAALCHAWSGDRYIQCSQVL